jgi:hypothetical protein
MVSDIDKKVGIVKYRRFEVISFLVDEVQIHTTPLSTSFIVCLCNWQIIQQPS